VGSGEGKGVVGAEVVGRADGAAVGTGVGQAITVMGHE
jgi:hypothetical protein